MDLLLLFICSRGSCSSSRDLRGFAALSWVGLICVKFVLLVLLYVCKV